MSTSKDVSRALDRATGDPVLKMDNDKDAQVPQPGLYTHKFWSTDMAIERQKLVQTLLLPLLYTSLLMWACLSLFWGSLLTANDLGRLPVALVNPDNANGFLGDAVIAGLPGAASPNALAWKVYSSTSLGEAERLVLTESVWAAVESKSAVRRRGRL